MKIENLMPQTFSLSVSKNAFIKKLISSTLCNKLQNFSSHSSLCNYSGRAMESAPILHQLIRYHPDHVKGLILLGDLYVNHMRDLDSAEKCYHRILEVEPDNIQARHNLCVVMVEAGQLLKARNCLMECLKVKHENYIVKHIQIIEERLELSTPVVNQSFGGIEDR